MSLVKQAKVLYRRLSGREAKLPPPAYSEQFSTEMDLPPFEGKPRVYLVASTPRCGSNLLGHGLIQSRRYGVPVEYLHPMHLRRWHKRFRTTSDAKLFDHLFRLRTSSTGWFGMKAHWRQFAPFEDSPIFKQTPIDRVIWIWRSDMLAQAVSLQIAKQTVQWISGAEARGETVYDYAAIAEGAEFLRDSNDQWRRFLSQRTNLPFTELVYEEMEANPEAEMARITGFLDGTPSADVAPSARTQRQRSGLNSEWADRFREDCKPEHRWILEPPDWSLTRKDKGAA